MPAQLRTDIEAPGPFGPLRGTLVSPVAGHAPVVLIVPGLGPASDKNTSMRSTPALRLRREGPDRHRQVASLRANSA